MVHWREKFANCTPVIVSHLNLEGDCGMDRVRRRRLLTPNQEATPEIVLSRKNLNSSSNVTNWITVDILKYFN